MQCLQLFTSIQQNGWQVENEVRFLKEALQELVRRAKAWMLTDATTEAEGKKGFLHSCEDMIEASELLATSCKLWF